MPKHGVAIALLAAGRAERFGGGKLDAPCAGKPLGAWAAQTVEATHCSLRLVVVPEVCPAFAEKLDRWRRVVNHEPQEGLSASIHMAAKAAQGCSRLVVVLADMPLVEASHLQALAAADGIAFTAYPDGGRGVPAAFPARCFTTLGRLTGSAARFDWGEEVKVMSPPRPESLMDVDRAEDLAAVQALLVGR